MDLRGNGWGGGCGVKSAGEDKGSGAGSLECGDDPSACGTTELVRKGIDYCIHRWQDNIQLDLKEIGYGLYASCSEQDSVVGLCGYSNLPLGSAECSEFLNQLSGYQLLKDCALWHW
jgi:hypothetical protein